MALKVINYRLTKCLGLIFHYRSYLMTYTSLEKRNKQILRRQQRSVTICLVVNIKNIDKFTKQRFEPLRNNTEGVKKVAKW